MIPWYSIVQPEDAEPEILVGPYECYVQALDYAPSAIDRAMTHTLMLQLDHERRFAVSQLGLDCSDFAKEHCTNVTRAIDCAVKRFESHRAGPEPVPLPQHDPGLIGLSLKTSPMDYVISLPDIHHEQIDEVGPAISSKVDRPGKFFSYRSNDYDFASINTGEPIDVDDAPDDCEQNQDDLMEEIRQWYKENRRMHDTQPRNYNAKRFRKPNALLVEHARVTRKRHT